MPLLVSLLRKIQLGLDVDQENQSLSENNFTFKSNSEILVVRVIFGNIKVWTQVRRQHHRPAAWCEAAVCVTKDSGMWLDMSASTCVTNQVPAIYPGMAAKKQMKCVAHCWCSQVTGAHPDIISSLEEDPEIQEVTGAQRTWLR
ncbi:hypothetical protein MUG91_G88n37 [Manis pentadactyla]|nr:hypothetical protein MUG91_G88n37 [Manis pentadactyla]